MAELNAEKVVHDPGIPMTVRELTPRQFGAWIEVPTRATGGWLYVIHDRYNDGYPTRTLGIIAGDDGSLYREEEFTNSDPRGYPETLSDVVEVRRSQPSLPPGQANTTAQHAPEAQQRASEDLGGSE